MESDNQKLQNSGEGEPTFKMADWINNPKEVDRYAWSSPYITALQNHGFENDEIKNVLWSIMAESGGKGTAMQKGGGGGMGAIQLTGDANKKQYSEKLTKMLGRPVNLFNPAEYKNPDVNPALTAAYFSDRDRGKGYHNFADVHRALAPKDRNPQNRIDWLNKNKIRPPDDTDFMIHQEAR